MAAALTTALAKQ